MEWVNQSRSFRLELEHFADGWGWSSWQELSAGGWQPLPTPAVENLRRRFRFRPQAEEFFCLMAEILADVPFAGIGREARQELRPHGLPRR